MSKQAVSMSNIDLFLIVLIVHVIVNSSVNPIKSRLESIQCVIEVEAQGE